MKKITFYTQATDKPEWRYLRNEVFVNHLDAVPIDRCDQALASCAGVIRSVLKSNMRLAFATFETCNAFGEVDGLAESFATCFHSYNRQGQRPLNGAMFYRDVLRFSQYPKLGRVAHSWWRGCLDAGDIFSTDDIGRASRVAPALAAAWHEAATAYGCTVFDNAVMWNSAGQFEAPYAETAHYTDSHSQTRWRRRVKGKVAETGEKVMQALESMLEALELAYYWYSLEIRIAPGIVFDMVVGALTIGAEIKQAVEQASQAGSDPNDPQQTQPVLRFGATWEAIIEGWTYAKTQSEEPLMQLLASFNKHSEGGDEYIDTDGLMHYTDLLVKVIKKVASTPNSDWFNPKSYKDQLSAQEIRRLPDIIELSF